MQEEIFGEGQITSLGEILRKENARHVLLVTGKRSYHDSGARARLEPLLSEVEVTRFSEFSVNPDLEDVRSGISLMQAEDIDLMIAVGGGSVMDMAKLVNLLSHQSGSPVDYVARGQTLVNKGVPLVAIPTTSGSGSEATRFAVVYVDQVKFSLSHDHLLPSYAIVDSEFTYSLSRKAVAVSGMDALAQAIESFWSVRSTEESRQYAGEAIRIILDMFKASLDGDQKAKGRMAWAAHLAGKAINLTTTTAPHAFSYFLTTYFKIPHGHAVALTLGEILVVNVQPTADNLSPDLDRDEYRGRMERLLQLLGCESVQVCRDKWYNLMQNVGLETSLCHAGGVRREDLQPIVDSVNMSAYRTTRFDCLQRIYMRCC